jgi:hypothetical protein
LSYCCGLYLFLLRIRSINDIAVNDILVQKLIQINHIYRFHLGVELLRHADEAGESLLRMLWDYEDAILCCSFKVFLPF